MTEEELQDWARYKESPTDENRNVLVLRYQGIAINVALKYKARLPDYVLYGELLSAAYEGLMQSVPKFDVSKGFQPNTYLSHRVWGAIQDFLRSTDDSSRLNRKRCTVVNNWINTLTSHPSPEEIIQRFDERHYTAYIQGCFVQTSDHDKWDRNKVFDTVDTYTPAFNVQELKPYLKGLNKKERLMILLYYCEGWSMKQIGRDLALSESRVSQLITQIHVRLRERLQCA